MLSRLVFMRLRAAEQALRAGRLDEAYRLASAADLRIHPRGKAVLEQLVEPLAERARGHFRGDRFAEALADVDRALLAGVRTDELAELRRNIETVANAVQRNLATREHVLTEARRRVEAGSLVAGRQILEHGAVADAEAAVIGQTIERRAAEAATMIEQGRQRLKEGQVSAAAERVEAARRLDAHNTAVVSLEAAVVNEGLDRTTRAIQEGRLARAAEELKALRDLARQDPRRLELEAFLREARRAADHLRGHAFGEARKSVAALAQMTPAPKWVDAMAKRLREAEDIDLELRVGPLGQWATWEPAPAGAARLVPVGYEGRAALDETVMLAAGAGTRSPSGSRQLLMLVDGGGSTLLIFSDRCSIGRVATEHPADVTLFGDLAERHAEIARIDEDYFLFGTRDVEIGGRMYRQQLLRDGDRVMLGRRAKFEFKLPSRKSLTAVLTLSDTTKMPQDVRTVLLFKDHATIGNGSTSHVRCRHAERAIVLMNRGGRLWAQPNGLEASNGQWVEVGVPAQIAGVSFVLQPWQARMA